MTSLRTLNDEKMQSTHFMKKQSVHSQQLHALQHVKYASWSTQLPSTKNPLRLKILFLFNYEDILQATKKSLLHLQVQKKEPEKQKKDPVKIQLIADMTLRMTLICIWTHHLKNSHLQATVRHHHNCPYSYEHLVVIDSKLTTSTFQGNFIKCSNVSLILSFPTT